MKKGFILSLFLLCTLLFLPITTNAQTANENSNTNADSPAKTATAMSDQPDTYLTGEVLHVLEKGERDIFGQKQKYQILQIKLGEGDRKGELIRLEYGGASLEASQYLKEGETVVLGYNPELKNPYYIMDPYRLPAILWILAIFFGVAVFFGRWHGFNSILGLGFSILVLAQFIIPNLVDGQNPLLITFAGAILIILVSMYLAHGISRKTTVAVVSTFATLATAIILALWFVSWSKLFGLGSEESFFLQLGSFDKIDLRGLLLSGMIIGTLGILDDITSAQSAAIFELKDASPSFGWTELYRRGLKIGKEHIASLINTLALAYAGASLPLFLLFSINSTQPLWVILNGEFIAEEIVRTLVGSSALLLAVPITTALAAWYWGNMEADKFRTMQQTLPKKRERKLLENGGGRRE